ncbi:MAG: ABC transporter ATP-binding protein [Brevinematales bacterium]|nr:ABC transporter ATP-binding protein [Brevinematales bacterium]
MSFLYTDRIRKEFGGVIAVADVDFKVEKNTITGLIGPNGAGKTTLFNLITGLETADEGFVFFKGMDITNLKAYQITRLGIARTFQNLRLFKEMTVLENLMVGRHFKSSCLFTKRRLFNSFFCLFNIDKEEKDIYFSSMKWLSFFGLEEYKHELPKNMPYGKQKLVEIARALCSEPEVLFLDEPAAGLNPKETMELLSMIKKIKELGITIVLIEHDMKFVMNLCENIYVLNYGRLIASGTPAEIQNNELVIEAYLGKENE